jgi:hypothetical protein
VTRAALLEAFTAADPLVLDGIVFPHPFIGPLTLRSWMELIAHHDARHAEQMAEQMAEDMKEHMTEYTAGRDATPARAPAPAPRSRAPGT